MEIFAIVFLVIIIAGWWSYIADTNRVHARNKLITELRLYTRKNKVKNRLVNQYCELRFWDRKSNLSSDDFVLCCREKTDGKHLGRIFYLRGMNEHVATVWVVFNMKFNSKSNYNSMEALYKSLRGDGQIVNLQNDRKLYNLLLPKNMAENDYCRMELVQSEQNELIIVCTDIWDMSETPRKFVIKGSYEYLYSIFNEFKNNKNRFKTYHQLCKKYEAQTEEQPVIKPSEDEIQKEEAHSEILLNNIDIALEDEIIKKDISKSEERKLDL